MRETDAEVIVLEDYKNLLCEFRKKDRGCRLVNIYIGFLCAVRICVAVI